MVVVLFLLFAAVAVGCAVNVVLQSHPIVSAVSLVGVMGSLALLYLQLGSPFIAAIQIIVYAGAVMVLFVFVIMLLNAGSEVHTGRSLVARYIGIPLLVLLLGLLTFLIKALLRTSAAVEFGEFTVATQDVGQALFTEYLLPFEFTSILILIAILGAVVLARKELN
jgi:NADH-quinone oxidoreductase subunit J